MTEEYTLVVPGPKICSKCGSWNRLEVHHIRAIMEIIALKI